MSLSLSSLRSWLFSWTFPDEAFIPTSLSKQLSLRSQMTLIFSKQWQILSLYKRWPLTNVPHSWNIRFLQGFFFIFWPHQVACGILVPRPVIETRPPTVEAWSPNHWTPGKSLPSAHKDTDLKFSCLKEHPFLPPSLVPQLIDFQMLELQGSIFGICLCALCGGKVPRVFPECQTCAFNYLLYSGSASQILHFQNRILDFLSPKFAPGSPYQWMIFVLPGPQVKNSGVILDSSSK